jgi:hypothetical protein
MFSNIMNPGSKFQVSSSHHSWNLTSLIDSGYGGYITGIKSENVYGETYGKTTLASSAKTFCRGMDQPSHVKYQTTMKGEFLDNAMRAENAESVATIVGVNRGEDMYKKVRNALTLL